MHEPFAQLLKDIGASLGLEVLTAGETQLRALGIRPDIRVDVVGALVGYVEVKPPGSPIPTTGRLSKADRDRWGKLQLLPNLLYCTGEQWSLFRYGQLTGSVAHLSGETAEAGNAFAADNDEFIHLVRNFLLWKPTPPRTVKQMVRAVANQCRLLRFEVTETLAREYSGQETEAIFSRLADDGRDLLYPGLTNQDFADAYAQTVTFALLLARADGINFEGRQLPEIARALGERHALLGNALAVMTEETVERSVAITTLLQVIKVIDWDQLSDKDPSLYLRLYEDFLGEYDQEVRRRTGSYYTPVEIASFMVRFVEEILRGKMDKSRGLASDDVVIADPAMGTGTFLLKIIDGVAETVTAEEGPSAVAPHLRALLGRLIGFEKQAGPYAIAELRIHQALRAEHATGTTESPIKLYVADTFDDPHTEQLYLPRNFDAIARSRREANQTKREQPVSIVIGNPPHNMRAKGTGGWIENGASNAGLDVPMDRFRAKGNARTEHVLSDSYVYFWRWATWKVFDAHPEQPSGIVAFITPSSYTTGQGYSGMREYLRRTADEGWIIDLSPEGHRPSISTRIFPGVQGPLCIGIFVRYGPASPDTPALIHYLSLDGHRAEKLTRLEQLQLEDPAWTECGTGWRDRLTPAEDRAWAACPVLNDLFPWHTPGVGPARAWVYSPDADVLRRRWDLLVAAPPEQKSDLFRGTRDRTIGTITQTLPGFAGHEGSIRDEARTCPMPIQVGYRSFDRQWIIPDNRLHDRPRPDLWRVRGSTQIYTVTQHTQPLTAGPGAVFSAWIPDMDHFMGHHGSQVLPLYRDAAGQVPNVAPGLLETIADRAHVAVPTAEDLLAYVACVVAHSGYTSRFREELRNPGVRVPLTADPALWTEAVTTGRQLLWLHSYGERFVDRSADRPPGSPRLPSGQQPMIIQAIPDDPGRMPDNISYDAGTETLWVGEGQIRPVPPQVWEYEISGMKVVRKWFGYRKQNPGGRRSSPLDDVVPNRWSASFTTELLELLNVLGLCVKLEPVQERILDRICQHPVITIPDLTQARVLPVKGSTRKPIFPSRDEQLTLGQPAASVHTGDADRSTGLAEQADAIRSSAAVRDYKQVKEGLTRLVTEDPRLAESLHLELGFIDMPDPDRQIIATAWSAITVGRAVESLLTDGGISPAHNLVETASTPVPAAVSTGPTPTVSAPRRSPQQSGALLEQATVDLFARFFTIEPDTSLITLRRQGAGAQFGHDIDTEWTVAGSPAVRCHIECKNLGRRVTVDDIAGKLAQQKYHHRGIQIDHWILISPHHDCANELPGMLKLWDQQGEYPFSVQIWTPATRVCEMFALEPTVYEAVYGRLPTQEEISASDEVAELIRQRLTPRLQVAVVWRRYLDPPGAFCFVNEDSRHFDGLYSHHLPLMAADERGALLGGTLMDQVIGWASNDAAAPMLLLADFGEGKSVFTYCLARRLCEEFRAAPDGGLFPLRIPLREFREAGTARGLLERRLTEVGATLAEWRTLTGQVRTLVILDGLDEMSADLSPAAITANLRDIRSCLTEFSGSKVLITSRQRILDGSRDWRRTMDRLGHPQIMRISSGPRRLRVQYLEQFATDDASAQVLTSLRSQYDPIGLAAKPLFLEMIKETLQDLPDDTFSETILYDTYINKSLQTKWELLADPGDELTSEELIENLTEILEDVAIQLQATNDTYLYLRNYQGRDRGKIAERLWEMRDQPVPREPFPETAQDDAANRVGIRSLLKAMPAPDTERWPVDFFHRSIREYFVAKFIVRSLTTDETRARQILSEAPLPPEIAHFAGAILRSRRDDTALVALRNAARSATTDRDDPYIGGNALTLLHHAGGLRAEEDWSGLRLDHARLHGADLHEMRFTRSSLRYANLDNANLEDADLTGADLEGVRLEETSRVIAVTALNDNRIIAAYDDRSLRQWGYRPGLGWESQIVTTLDHKAVQLQVTPMGRVLASGEGMLSVLDVAGATAGPVESAESGRSGSANRAGEATVVRCAFRASSRCQAAVLGARSALFAEEGDDGQLLITWLDIVNARILDQMDVDETVTAWTQLEEVLFAFATPDAIHVIFLPGNDRRKTITIDDPAVTCLSVRAESGYVLLAAGHHDGSVSLTQLALADNGVVAPQRTRHLHGGPVTDIFLDAEDRVITGSTDRSICVTPLSVVRSDSISPDLTETAVQSLHLTLRCKGVHFDDVRTEHEQEKLRKYSGA